MLVVAGLEDHGCVVIVRVCEDALHLGHHGSVFEQDDIEGIRDVFKVLNVHSLDLESQGVETIGRIQFVADHEFLKLSFL